mgnify:CR=1 FL=1|jgi:glyoxylase-like metal-dependent hydrolase (beta-lactamase superfamily II)|tara:strand:+ start:1388 stop:2074 length:687 start_codon:yes stop_codon:yes gene_type:complete
MIKQFFDEPSSSFTYLVTSQEQKAFLVDPVLDNNKIYQNFISQNSLKLSFILETHTHADHITGAAALNDIYDCKTFCGLGSSSKDIEMVCDGQEIFLDNLCIKALYTPGHTDDSFSYLLKYSEDCYLFSGDTLLINGCGRTDFQNGDPELLYDSINQKLFSLEENTIVMPGHDYNGLTSTTIGEQKTTNPRLTNKSKEEFIHIMNNLNLPSPKMMDVAVPLNLNLGKK